MLRPEFFSAAGLLALPGSFDREWCVRLISEMRTSQVSAAEVTETTGSYIDRDARSTSRVKVSQELQASVERCLLAVKPQMEKRFGLALAGCQNPQFLTYRTGDFFHKHGDSATEEEEADEYLRRRKVSAVVFLNDQTESPQQGCYTGGSLTFYGLIKDVRLKNYGFPIPGEAGLLVGFPSGMIHEVTRITSGERHTIVSWFY